MTGSAALLKEGRLEEAAKGFRARLESSPKDPDALAGLGRIAILLGRLGEAETLLSAALGAHPAHADALCVRGALAEAKRDVQGAVSFYQRAVASDPKSATARFNLGRALGTSGDAKGGVKELEEATRLDPAKPEAWYALGVCRHLRGDLGGSIAAFTEVLAKNPAHLDGYLTLADVLCEVQRFGAAEKLLLQGISLLGPSSLLLDRLAGVQVRKGDLQAALRTLERQVEVDKDNERAYLNLSTFSQLAGDLLRAERAVRRLLERDPKSAEGRYHLGNILEALDRADEAIAAYETSIQLAPDRWRAHNNLGFLLCSFRDDEARVEAGRAALERAVELTKESGEPMPRLNLGLVHLNAGRFQEAAALLSALAERLPDEHKLKGQVDRALALARTSGQG